MKHVTIPITPVDKNINALSEMSNYKYSLLMLTIAFCFLVYCIAKCFQKIPLLCCACLWLSLGSCNPNLSL